MKHYFVLFISFFFAATSATALSEIHFSSDSTTATITETDYTNPFLITASPQQKPQQPFEWIQYIYTLDRRLLEIKGASGTLIKVFYRPDLQIDYVQDNFYQLTIFHRYNQQNQLIAHEYFDANNKLIQKTSVALTPYNGMNSHLQGSLLEKHTYTLFDYSSNPALVNDLNSEDYFRRLPNLEQDFPPNTDISILSYYTFNAQGRVIEREEHYYNNQLTYTTYYLYNSMGFVSKIYTLDHSANKVVLYHLYYYYSCPQGNVIKSVFVLDDTGGRFADYVYDSKDPCKPYTSLLMIKDRATGKSLYTLDYYP